MIYQRALAEATGMAAISGKMPGGLISVEEPQMSGNYHAKLQKKQGIKLPFSS